MTTFYVLSGLAIIILSFIISRFGSKTPNKTKDLLEEGITALKKIADAEEKETKR